jgi:hypothetical protein
MCSYWYVSALKSTGIKEMTNVTAKTGAENIILSLVFISGVITLLLLFGSTAYSSELAGDGIHHLVVCSAQPIHARPAIQRASYGHRTSEEQGQNA